MKKRIGILSIILVLLSSLILTGCTSARIEMGSKEPTETKSKIESTVEDEESAPEKEADTIDEDGFYYDLESVVLYLDEYGKLPSNYITKKEAEKLGWEGGPVSDYVEGGALGGTHFGNYEKLLPEGNYKECDIDTENAKGRGAKRLVYSDDGKYYYTDDHYESFSEVIVKDGTIEVIN
ncbi:MAG: ribonuclease [Lachnospiraceae bacterium]|nr:ribonuclease [Lachnospiraceae bacterium]